MSLVWQGSRWLTVQRADEDDVTEKEDMGEVLVTIEVLPKEAADARPNGKGRSSPNDFPYLPPPVGRIKWGSLFNPLYLIRTLCGPAVLYALLGCFCLLIFIYCASCRMGWTGGMCCAVLLSHLRVACCVCSVGHPGPHHHGSVFVHVGHCGCLAPAASSVRLLFRLTLPFAVVVFGARGVSWNCHPRLTK